MLRAQPIRHSPYQHEPGTSKDMPNVDTLRLGSATGNLIRPMTRRKDVRLLLDQQVEQIQALPF